MSFFDEIKKCFPEIEQTVPSFRATIIGDSAGYFENVSGIKYYTTEEVFLNLKKGGLKIKGEELYIKKYCAGDVVICGKIKSLEKI